MLARWADIVAAEFHYRTESPAPAAPVLKFLIKHREAFLSAWGAKADLDGRAEEGRKSREICLIETEGEARVNAREPLRRDRCIDIDEPVDLRVAEALMSLCASPDPTPRTG